MSGVTELSLTAEEQEKEPFVVQRKMPVAENLKDSQEKYKINFLAVKQRDVFFSTTSTD